jgi:hypothetical protein
MAYGRHFFSDVVFAALMMGLVIWLAHGLIFRWARTRLDETAIDRRIADLAYTVRRLFSAKRYLAKSIKFWRMPLAAEYDKMFDSKFADMKNTGGSRWAGAITAAQFIKRFVNDETLSAHLDIAGTGARLIKAGARGGACDSSTGWGQITTKK